MAVSEVQSLDQIQYKGKFKLILTSLIAPVLFILAFLSFYPVGDKLKSLMKSQLAATGCNPDFKSIHMEWLLPKIVVTDLSLPAACLNRQGAPLEFNFLKINWQIINFSPFGIPFRIDTEFSGQPLSVYFVQGIGKQMVRLKDQSLSLSRLQPLMGDTFKVEGNLLVDLNLLMADQNIQSLALKASSKDFQLPSQNIQGFTLQNLKLGDLFLEANSENPPRITVDRLIIGDPDSPIRANFRGTIDLMEGNAAFSPMDLAGEIAFSEGLKQSLPLVDMMFQSFTQKDGFYQVRLGGTLGAPKPSAP